jgi:DUF1680 family protein
MGDKKKISRREFVGSAVGAAAVTGLAGKSLLASAAASPVPSGKSLRASNAATAAASAQSAAVALIDNPAWKDQGVENLTKSPFAKLRDVPVRAVTIQTGFWSVRRDTNVTKSIPSMHDLLEANGRMNNFRRLTGKSSDPQKGPVYSDSDVYKWTEAVGFALQSGDIPALRATTEKVIDDVVAAQQSNGYLNTYYVRDKAELSMTPQTQSTGHELYNMGHYLQGAIAYYRGTGDRKMLDAGIRFVNDFLLPSYGPAPLKPLISGHPEFELAVIELYRLTGDKRHLDIAGYLLQGDSRIEFPPQRFVYMNCGVPFTGRTKVEGHAVRAMYECCGATDYYLETGDPAYWKALNTVWDDMTGTKMYVTGGVGSRGAGEAFGDPYELPNYRAYGESCAAIGNMMWNWRMLAASGDAKFTDVIERALYNGINSGMSLDGVMYCYRNPLAFDASSGEKIRNPWYDTTCCPPNLERTFASLPGYFYSTSADGIYVHLYDNSVLDWHLENGTPLKVTQETNYPWDGAVKISVAPAQPSDFVFYMRIPGWAGSAQVSVNGKATLGAIPGKYMAINRKWSAGDVITLKADMTPQALVANARVIDDSHRVAIQRGPIVYCLEQLDQPSGVQFESLAVDVGSDPGRQFKDVYKKDLLGGVVVLEHNGVQFDKSAADSALYSKFATESPKSKKVAMTFIPYYAWDNREQSNMEVWTPVKS